MSRPERRLQWLRECRDLQIPFDVAVRAGPLLLDQLDAQIAAAAADDGCYAAGAVATPGLHRPDCNAIRNGGPCDVGRGAESQ